MRQVGIVTSLHLYPIKSCRGIPVPVLHLDPEQGASHESVFDRSFAVVNESGVAVTQREVPTLATVSVSIESPDYIVLGCEGKDVVRVANKPFGLPRKFRIGKTDEATGHLSEDGSQFFSDLLGGVYTLVRIDSIAPRIHEELGETARLGAADAFPLLLANEASLDDLNDRLRARGKQQVPMNRFRPNIGIAGAPAYAEDEWNVLQFGNGFQMRNVKKCQRCIMTTINQNTGVIDEKGEPLQTLMLYRGARGGPHFAANLVIDSVGDIRQGDSLYVV